MGTDRTLCVAGAAAAVAGGLMWIVKGGVILAVGDQPPLLFEAAGVLFPVALIALHSRLIGDGDRRVRTGGMVARLAGGAAAAAGCYALLVPNPSDVVLGVTFGLCGLATVVGLVLLGLAARRMDALPQPWRNLPLAMGVAAVPAIAVIGGILEAIHERLLELPLVAFGVAWVVFGFVLWSRRDVADRGKPAPRVAQEPSVS
jgi:hypothetical protein